MRLEIDRNELLHAARLGQRFCGNVKTNAVLANILLRAEEEVLEIAATDLNRMLRYRLNPEKATGIQPGSVLLSGDRLVGILQASSEQTVLLEEADGRVEVHLGKGRFEIYCEDPGNFPSLPPFPEQVDIITSGRALVETGQKCAVATTSLEERFAFDAVCLIVSKGEIKGISTDGRRLVSVVREVENRSEFSGKKLVPPDLLAQVGKLGPVEDPVEIAFGQRHIFMRTGRAEMAMIDRDGRFPPIEKVFEKQPNFTIEVGRTQMLQALQQVEFVLDDKENTIVLRLTQNSLLVLGESSQGGRGEVELPLTEGHTDQFEVEFNPGLLIEFLKVMEDDRLVIGFRGPSEQVLFQEKGAGVDYLVMPIRRDEPQGGGNNEEGRVEPAEAAAT